MAVFVYLWIYIKITKIRIMNVFKKIKYWYFMMWVDGIIKFRSLPINKDDWKFKTIILVSMAMTLKAMLLDAIIERHITHTNFYNINIDIFPGENLDAFLNAFIIFILPFILINYFFIFRKDRYKFLISKYEYKYNGKLFSLYTIGTFSFFLIFFISILLIKILTNT